MEQFVLGYVHNGVVCADFLDSLVNLVVADNAGPRRLASITKQRGPIIAYNRNKVAERFLANSTTPWLLFVDTDMKFNPADVYKLLDAADPVARPIVSGLAFSPARENQLICVWGRRVEGAGGPFKLLTQIKPTLQSIDCVGMAFTLIHRGVLMAMRDAYGKGDDWPWFGHDLVDGVRLGEDWTFCERARAMGFSIWGAGHVTVGHMKLIEINPRFARAGERA
jgi:hypothetical protein